MHGEKTAAGGAVTRMVAATRTVTIPFYFPRSLVSSRSLARSGFRLLSLALPLPSLFLHPRPVAFETTQPLGLGALLPLLRAHEKVYLNTYSAIGRSVLIASRPLLSCNSSKAGTAPLSLFIHPDGHRSASIGLVSRACERRKTESLSGPLVLMRLITIPAGDSIRLIKTARETWALYIYTYYIYSLYMYTYMHRFRLVIPF